jgi:hypothetical protein
MEEQKKQEYPEGCKCFICRGKMACGNWHWHRFVLLKLLIGIIILIAVFAAGVKIGELKSTLGRGGYGRHGYNMMQPYYGQPYRGMMQWPKASTGTVLSVPQPGASQ